MTLGRTSFLAVGSGRWPSPRHSVWLNHVSTKPARLTMESVVEAPESGPHRAPAEDENMSRQANVL